MQGLCPLNRKIKKGTLGMLDYCTLEQKMKVQAGEGLIYAALQV